MSTRTLTLRGAKGSSAPFEATDTLRATQRAQIVDLLGEGQIGGLVNGLRSVYIDGVPVENADASRNFPEFGLTLTLGGPTSEADHPFADVQTEVGVGVTVLAAVPVVRTITDATADAVRVTLQWPQLLERKENGDVVGAACDFAIDIQSAGGGYVERWAETVSGKASAPYPLAVRLSLVDVGPAPWDVRVRRVTADSGTADLVDAFSWASYTVVSGVRMLYRNSAVARLEFDAKNFTSIPQRWYDVMGLSDWDIPVNYDPLARTVSGPWSGLWTQGWTNNPAWVVHNLVKHPRYGLGDYVVDLPDKWVLYQLSLWCDEMLDDGRGGTEPRYSINVALADQREALLLLQEICSVFRGVLLHGGSSLTLTWDAPGTPVASYTPANVVDGLFTYADGSSAAKKTSCTCWYSDRWQAGKRIPTTWDDDALVTKYGLRNFEINPIGVATPGQALRMAKWALYTAHYEEQTVAFRVAAEGQVRRPGEVFQVTDPSETGERLGGRIHAATTTTVQLDAPVLLAGGETYTLWVTQPHATDPGRLVLEGRTVTTAAGTVSALAVTPAFSAAPVVQTVWLLEGTDVAPTLWRFVEINPVKGDGGREEYEVLGVRHEPGKWDLVEHDQPLTISPTRRLRYGAPPVASVDIEESLFDDALGNTHIRATVSWPIPAPGLRFVLSWRGDNGPWLSLPPMSDNLVDFDDVQPGFYEVQVQSMNGLGQLSPPTSASALILGDLRTLPDVAAFTGTIKVGQVVFAWADQPRLETELRVGASWAASVFGWAGQSSEYKLARPPNGTYKIWAKHRFRNKYSVNAVSVDVTVDDSIDGGGGGALVLEINGPPLFRFADGTTHTTTDPDLTLTARLISLFGEADWEARAFDAMTGGTDLGAVTLTGTGNARVLTGANFVAAGTSGSVRRVDVVASIGSAFDTQSIFRYDPTVTEPFLYLANPLAVVSTDEAGNYGDYSKAKTPAAVLDTGADVTSTWTLSIEPDAGLTSTINGGAGPITGTGSVEVAVSASTLPDGVVLVRATKPGETDLTAPFRLVKRPAQGVERLLYFAPRTDIVLPTDSAGNPTTFTNAWTKALVRLKSGLDATDQYTFSKVDEGVVSELTGNTIRITAWVSLGLFGTTVSVTPGVGSTGWERPAPLLIRGPDAWIQPGLNTNIYAPFSVARRSVDYETWVDVALGVTEHWSLGAATDGNIVLGNNSNSNQVLRSTDGGLTYSPVTLPVTNAFQHMRGQAGTFIFLPIGHTTGLRSTDGGASFSAITVPSGPFDLFGVGIDKWLFKNSSSSYSISLDNGTSWSATAPPAAIKSAIGFLGLIVAAYSGASSQVAYSEDNGATWANAALPYSCTDGRLLNIRGVLYLYGSAKVQWSLDGRRWQGSGATVTSSDLWLVSADELDIDVLPLLNNLSGIWAKMPMTATSAQEGAVHVKAHTPGEDDLEATLPVQLGAIVPPVRISNINPGLGVVLAGADGVATNMSQAQFAATVVESSLTVTTDYTWAWSTTHMTPSTGSGATAALTDMDAAQDRGSIQFTGTAPGKDTVTLSAEIIKIKGETNSGLNIGAAYRVSSVTNTHVGFQLTDTGAVERREGSSGSWVRVGRWNDPEGAGVGTGIYVRFRLKGSIDGSSTLGGTFDAWLQLTSTRGISLADVTTGDHQAEVIVDLADNATGIGALNSLVTLILTVP